MLKKINGTGPIKLFGKPSIVSLVLLVLVLCLWVRSNGRSMVHFERGRFIAFVSEGGVTLRVLSIKQGMGSDLISMDGWAFLGFGWYRMTYTNGYHDSLEIPLWPLVLLLAILPVRRFRQLALERRTNRRRAANLCVACGYDVRASGGVCPECGAANQTERE
jgi:hypothetical protein